MRLRHALVCLLLLGGCSLDRAGLLPSASDGGGGRDAMADARTDAPPDGSDGCAPGTVDVDGNAANGCECMLTSPSTEFCDGVDNDCNPSTADGAQDPRLLDPCDDPEDPDLCVDDVTLCEAGRVVCRPRPSDAVEICNGIDDDCNDLVDDDATDAIGFSVDADGDGHGDPAGVITMACEAPPGQASPSDDCDETNAAVFPGATEICNTIDDNCDGVRDETDCPCDEVEHAGHLYLFCTAEGSWTGARGACGAVGYQLVTVDDASENGFVRSEATMRGVGNFWIGYNDRSSERDFVWQGPGSSYLNWHSGEPNNGGCPRDIRCSEDCVEMWGDGTWNDQPCDDSRAYVCEAP